MPNHPTFQRGISGRLPHHFQPHKLLIQRNFVRPQHRLPADKKLLVQLNRPFVVQAARCRVHVGVLPNDDMAFFQPQLEQRFQPVRPNTQLLPQCQ